MKVTYNERYYLDKYRCIDKPITRHFITSWAVNDLIYFKANEFNIFSVEKDNIISIEN